MADLIELFKDYQTKKSAIYGLGVETKNVLPELENVFEIVGLLDSFQQAGKCYGKPIISVDKAIESGVELIIVVARPGSCKAIAKKIGDKCKSNGIALFDIRGKNLLESNQIKYDFSNMDGMTQEQLRALCDNAGVVSFDLFDTLVARKVLEPTDIIDLVNQRLIEKGIIIKDFFDKRLASEKKLSKTFAPKLVEIYDEVLENCAREGCELGITSKELANLEWTVDYGTVVAREDMVQVFKDVYTSGKRVYVVSDTYYSKEQLVRILNKCGIEEWTDIFASCEYGTGKMQNLFMHLKEKESKAHILHVGNDLVADVNAAKTHGLDACHVYSGLDLLEHLGYLGLEEYICSIADKIRVGMFVARLFNSPFQFEKKISVENSYDIGYLFCAPMITDFVCWFNEKVRDLQMENIWFGARDGYLIQKLYNKLQNVHGEREGVAYLLTSRACAIRAGIESAVDLGYVDGMKYHGTIEENLKERFGLNANEIPKCDVDNAKTGLLKYGKTILETAKGKKKNYLKYIHSINVKKGEVAFFDFVAKGTCQLYLQRIAENQLKGFYFLRLEPENEQCKELDIESFYSLGEKESSSIFENYYILETVLTAPHPSVKDFDENGGPVYAVETRSAKDIECFTNVQEGILSYMDDYVTLCPKTNQLWNKKMDEVLLDLIHKIEIGDDDFLNLVVEDPFFNRMTNITDVL